MRCPKCHYISYDSGERCRNCGYELSLTADAPPPAPDLPLRRGAEPFGPLTDLSLSDLDRPPPADRTPFDLRTLDATPGRSELPLFAGDPADDRPLVTPPAAPRPPLAVRRPTPEAHRRRVQPLRAVDEPAFDLAPAHDASPPSSPGPTAGESPAAGAGRRLLAGAIDLAILAAINGTVLYLTLAICDLPFAEIGILPVAPLAVFFLLLDGGYSVAFTAAGGQTIGKMAAGIRVVADAPDARVGVGEAVLRTAAYFVSALPAGLGFLPMLVGRRTLHDRLADTRVVKAT